MPTMRRSTRASAVGVNSSSLNNKNNQQQQQISEESTTAGNYHEDEAAASSDQAAEPAATRSKLNAWSTTSSPLSSVSTPASNITTAQQRQRGRTRRQTIRAPTAAAAATAESADEDSVDELLSEAAKAIRNQVTNGELSSDGAGSSDGGPSMKKRQGPVDTVDHTPVRKHRRVARMSTGGSSMRRQASLAATDDERGEATEPEAEAEAEAVDDDGPSQAVVSGSGGTWWPGKRGRPPKSVLEQRRLAKKSTARTPRAAARRGAAAAAAEDGSEDEDGADLSVLETPTRRPTRKASLGAALSMHAPQGSLVAPTATVSSSDDSEDEADSEGERKIDALGQLLGGREFICPVVTSPFRSNPRRQYILTMDCCRFTGARDSYMLFKQHPRMRRVETTQRERDMLADKRLIPKVTRFRPIAMITARTAFREFGARIVKNGRYVTDDYWVAARRQEAKFAEGAVVANMGVYHSVMAAHAAGVTPGSTRKARRLTPLRSPESPAGALGPASPTQPGAVVSSWAQIHAQQPVPPSQLQLRAGAGALTMATAFEKADAGAGADADAAIARRKPVFRRIRAAETAEAAFEPAAAAHRMHFDDRGFVDGLPLVQSLAAAWPRTASLTNRLKQRRADSAAEATADADAGAEDLFGPMAYASAKAAREFNAATRMWREDNGGTWVDPHTGIRQVPANLQPTAVRAERVDATSSRWRRTGSTRVDALVSFTDAPALATPASDAYPLALLPGQFQSSFPMHHTRFGQTQAQALTSYSNLWSSHWTMQQIYAQQHRKLLQKRLAQ